MDSMQFFFKWKNHSDLMVIFNQLWALEELVDVILSCEDGEIKAHRMMLSASSPVFRKIFSNSPSQYRIIFLRDTKYAELKMILDFIYKGEIIVPGSQLGGLIKTAEALKINGLGEFGEADEEVIEESIDFPYNPPKEMIRRKSPSSDSIEEIPVETMAHEFSFSTPKTAKKLNFTSHKDKIVHATLTKNKLLKTENSSTIKLMKATIEEEQKGESLDSIATTEPILSQDLSVSTVSSQSTSFDALKSVKPVSNDFKINVGMNERLKANQIGARPSENRPDTIVSDTSEKQEANSRLLSYSRVVKESILSKPNNSKGYIIQ
ncbi:modifier of mdg4-like [Centruroides vittatus]|uniref:modifier of mdg4-like n=1 Tax=Centruroides vittatus TaxID=120091 RepID=UPI003510A1AC